MALIYLYILPVIFYSLDIGPFTIAAVLFSLCYLPGLAFSTFIKNDRLEIEDLIFAFPVSIGTSCLLTLGLLYIGTPVKFIAYIIHGVTGLIILIHIIKYRKPPSLPVKLSKEEIKFIIIALLMTIILSIPVISERVAISAHGFHHLSMVNQIFNGIFPPENPGLGGTSISYHWGYHALVAAISFPADFHPLRVFSMLNIISLFFIFCLAYRAAKAFGFSEGYSLFVPIALIGLMRSDTGIYLIKNIVRGQFVPLQDVISNPLELLSSWVNGISYLDRRLFFINKFYNANNMPLGICLIMSFFLNLLLLTERGKNDSYKKMYLVSLSLVLIAVAITYAFFLMVPLLFMPLWLVILFIANPGGSREKFREVLLLLAPCAIAAVISAPYLIEISRGPNVMTHGQSISEYKFFYWDVQAIRNLVVYLLPSPLIIAGYWLAYRQIGFSRKMLFMLSGTVLFLLLSLFLRLQWYNEEKFSFVLSFFFSLMFVYSLTQILPLFSRLWLRKSIAVCIILFLLSAPLITEAAYLCSPWFRDRTYAFSGIHVNFARDKSRNEAYLWIRKNTPHDALILLPYVVTQYWDNTAHIASYQPAVLSERNLFVIKDVYAFMSPGYEKRVSIRAQLFKNPGDPQTRQYMSSLGRNIYLLTEEVDDPLLKGVVYDRVPSNAGGVFMPVFESDRQKIYKIRYDNHQGQ